MCSASHGVPSLFPLATRAGKRDPDENDAPSALLALWQRLWRSAALALALLVHVLWIGVLGYADQAALTGGGGS